ncbi:MAG TPA: hypothetical protein VIV60_37680, partial [Polyangiaceae bacterium]
SSTGNGGAVATGGSTKGSGGAATTGGSATTGSATGGKAAGGATSAGGSATGGKAAGGATSAGGSATGGKAAGGVTSAGGNASGGANATGGASNSTCPALASQTCTVGDSNCFSFFVASRARMFALAQAFNGSTKGWGGDFKYGTSDGLTGADKLCTEIAKQSMPDNCRTWKAFLSTSKVNAIDRVGKGPWYDRLNRTIANNLTELVAVRPGGITNSTILNNLPNEDGTPHHNEEVGCTNLNSCADNHDVLTGSDGDGKLCTSTTCAGGFGSFPGGGGGSTTITDYTCKDWTLGTSTSGIAPRVGHTWPTAGSIGGGTMGTGGGSGGGIGGGQDDWISQLTESGCAPGYNLVQNGGPQANGLGSVGDGGGYGAIYCFASQ